MTVVCAAENITCERGGRAVLTDVSVEICSGEVLALVGPNGAGKSTLLAVLAGDLDVTAGSVTVRGRPVSDWRPRDLARERSVLLQANDASFAFPAREVVRMGRNPWPAEAETDAQTLDEAVERTDIAHLLDRPFTALSGGEKARVSLARVLAQDTPTVFLDEPTAALDLRHQEDVMQVARDLATAGRAVVVVLHDLSVAAAWSDRVVMVDDGRVVADGIPAQVLSAERVEAVYGVAVHETRTPDGHHSVVPRRRPVPHSDTMPQ